MWNSPVFVTFFDVLIIVVTALCLVVCIRKRRGFRRGDMGRETDAVWLGLVAIGLFYVTDLATMWLVPLFSSQPVATRTLPAGYHWGVWLFAVTAIFIGFVRTQDRFLGLVAATRQAEVDLASESAIRRESEEAWRDSEERNRALLLAIPDMMFRNDADGTFLEFVAGEGIEPLVPPGDFRGKTLRDVLPPEIAEAAMHHIGQVLQTGRVMTHEYSLPIGDDVRHFEYRMVPSNVNEVLGIVRDITERKRAADALKQANEDLEARVESRTRDLHEANVALRAQIEERQQANDEAGALREELAHVTRVATMGELAASIAHELNQPLAAMVSNAQAARRFLSEESPELDEVQEALEEIAEDGKRAGKVIRGLRELLKRGDRERKVLEVNQFVEDVLALVRSDAVMHNITLTTRLASDLPKVSGDQVQLQQVVLNLLRNGSEAMGDLKNGKRELVIATALGNAGDVEISVRDSGAGINADDMWRLFDAFYTTKPDGLGMGLSINRSIVEAHKGRIWATPNADDGTTFHFTLPTVGE